MLSERVIEWTEQWKQAGRQEGLQAGEAVTLLRLLEHRFGALSEGQQARLRAAEPETLFLWGQRLLTAQSLDDVLG